MRLGGFLESGTLGMLKQRLGRPWGPHEAETSVWLGSWWLLTGFGFSEPRRGTAAAAGG
jgi:hypothetical protein